MTKCQIQGLLAIYCFLGWSAAQAHVKWFAPFDTHVAPLTASAVVDQTFFVLSMLLAGVLFFGYAVDRWIERSRWMTLTEQRLEALRDRLPDMLRVSVAIFFGALWAKEGIILTPELTTDSAVIPWLQFFIALATMFRRTLLFSGVGIIALYVFALMEYGIFHLLDYPIFLGIGLYLMLTGIGHPRLLEWRMPILFGAVGVTLMWAGIEKFSYPHWTFPILGQKPAITFGIDHKTYMCCAGFAEFMLAFMLISSTALVRVAGGILLLMFTAAIFEFGKIDALGHLLIIVVLAMFVIHGKTPLQDAFGRLGGTAVVHSGVLVFLHFIALAIFMFTYQVAHYIFA